MTRVVINNCFGGFGLSHKAILRYASIKGIKLYWYLDEISREIHDKYHPGEEIDPNNTNLCVHYNTEPDQADQTYFSERDINRDDAALIQIVEEMGEAANGRCANLQIVDVPDDVKWQIEEYDGNEWVAEAHRRWS